MSIHESATIQETACVDEGAAIGRNTKVWHWTHICKGAHVGDNCVIGQNVYISKEAYVGDNVKIQNNVSVYDKVKIEKNVFCGPSMVFTNVINPRAEISRREEFKQTTVRNGATLGANCTIICGVEIGRYAFIGAGCVITKDVKPYALMIGVPGVQIGWMSKTGERVDLPLEGEGIWICKTSKDKYQLTGDSLNCI